MKKVILALAVILLMAQNVYAVEAITSSVLSQSEKARIKVYNVTLPH